MYLPRYNQAIIEKSFAAPMVTALLGSRRVGKTTLVENYINSHSEKNFILLNMDLRVQTQQVAAGHLIELIEQTALQTISAEKPLIVVIDEAQKCPELFDQVKYLYDHFKDQAAIKFILTGSGFLSLHQLASESLAGRIELHHLREFNTREAAALIHGIPLLKLPTLTSICQNSAADLTQSMRELSPYKNILQQSLNTLLVWGGLPEVLQCKTDEERIRYLSNYLQTYLEKDVRAIATITDLNLYEKLIDIVAEQTGSLRDDKKIIEAISCSRDTLKKYRGYLSATLVYTEIFPFIHSTLKRLVKSPKAYLNNNGLISYLTRIDQLNILERSGQVGHRLENWFLKELLTFTDTDVRRSDINFWRTSAGVEVDFILRQGQKLYPFEVTYKSKIDTKKLKNLKQFMNEEAHATQGYYIYNGEFRYDKDLNIYFLPAWAIG